LLGADDTDGLILGSQTIQVQNKAEKILLQRAQQTIPEFAGTDLLEQCRSVIGMRGMPIDERSIAGPMLSAEGLYILVTHSGISLAPVLGKLIADCIEYDEIPGQLQPFSLDRFDR
jgi:glycine/D-amino acid oxidase-like deaminating enzyme